MSLPAELRNEIYNFALVKNFTIFANGSQEPGLLAVSREIRNEATAVFYKNNSFSAHVYNLNFAPVSAWLKGLVPKIGPKPFVQFSMVLLESHGYTFFPRVSSLVKVFHETGLELASKTYSPNPTPVHGRFCSGILSDTSVFRLAKITAWKIQHDLEQAIALGRKGHQGGWSTQRMDQELISKLEARLNDSRIKPSLKNEKKKAGGVDKERGRWIVKADFTLTFLSTKAEKEAAKAAKDAAKVAKAKAKADGKVKK